MDRCAENRIVMLLMVVCVGGLSVWGQTPTQATTPAATRHHAIMKEGFI
jgi:hypothetical protein